MKLKYQYKDVYVGGYLKRWWLLELSTERTYIFLNWPSVASAKEYYDYWNK